MPRTILERDDVILKLAEVFRDAGFEGTTLSVIASRTGIGKGSLYHFFPGGKDEMAAAVLDHIHAWFQREIFDPLIACDDPASGLRQMMRNVDVYFQSGQRVCLVGLFALSETRDRFTDAIRQFFVTWQRALVRVLKTAGLSPFAASAFSDSLLVRIQGALVLARATADYTVFGRTLKQLQKDIDAALDA